jgi:hypothetical protein
MVIFILQFIKYDVMFQVVDKYLRDGWNGNQMNKHGTPLSILN